MGFLSFFFFLTDLPCYFWCILYWFAVATLRNYHKLDGLKQQKFNFAQFLIRENENKFHCAKSRYGQVMLPQEALVENMFLISCVWQLPTFFGLWPHHSNFCLYGHITFSFCIISFCCSHIRVFVITFRGYNPG